jgi:hypothetical protein
MTISAIEAGADLGEVESQSAHSPPSVDLNNVPALCSLMKMYESGQVSDEDESEVDLMIQLSGMVYSTDSRSTE